MASDSTRLRVTSGLHAGATVVLPDDGMSIIGAAADCDVYLFDPGIALRHVAISRSGETRTLRCVDGSCAIGGRNLTVGESCIISPGDEVQLGESQVVIGIESGPATTADCTAQPAASNVLNMSKLIAVSSLAILIAVTAVTGIFAPVTPERDPLAEVNTILSTAGVADPVQAIISDGTIVVTGIVSEADYADLQHALSDLDFPVVNSTQSSTVLLEQVRSVFRTNGYHAELSYTANGIVQVANLNADNPNVQAVALRVRTDVPAVTKLDFAEIDDGDLRADSLAYPTDPDKRLTTIIDGDIAYVATVDGGRYFVGGILPGGFVLTRINEDGIQVDDNGEIRWLKL